MMLIEFNSSAPVLRGIDAAEDISVAVSSEVVYTGTPTYARDALVAAGGAGTLHSTVNVAAGSLGWSGQIANANPDIGTLAGNVITSTANGTATLLINAPGGTRAVRVSCQVGIGQSTTPQGYKPGSLAAHSYDLIRGWTDGKVLTDATSKVYDAVWQLNPMRIAPNLDMSWQEVYHGNGDIGGPCSLITPRHALAATHYNVATLGTWDATLRPNCTSTFRRRDGTLQTVKVIGKADLGNDLSVLYFDADVTDCAFGKLVTQPVLEAKCPNLYTLLPPLQAYALPCITTTRMPVPGAGLTGGRRLTAHAAQIAYVTADGRKIGGNPSLPAALSSWGTNIQSGDSGSSLFIPVIEPGQSSPTAVLLTAWHGGGGGSGPDYGNRAADINTALNTLAGTPQGTYTVQLADLSAFTSF